jgi:hypothetical protein
VKWILPWVRKSIDLGECKILPCVQYSWNCEIREFIWLKVCVAKCDSQHYYWINVIPFCTMVSEVRLAIFFYKSDKNLWKLHESFMNSRKKIQSRKKQKSRKMSPYLYNKASLRRSFLIRKGRKFHSPRTLTVNEWPMLRDRRGVTISYKEIQVCPANCLIVVKKNVPLTTTQSFLCRCRCCIMHTTCIRRFYWERWCLP